MINWLSSLFDKKCEEVESSGSENVAEKNEANTPSNHKATKKKEVEDVLRRNPLLDLKEIELRDLSKHQIDALEQWCRRLIDDIFNKNYGTSEYSGRFWFFRNYPFLI